MRQIGEPSSWRGLEDELRYLRKTIRAEKLKANFMKKRMKRLERDNQMLDQSIQESGITEESSEDDVICLN